MDQLAPSPPHLIAALDGVRTRVRRSMTERAERASMSVRASEARLLYLIADGGTRQTELAEGAWITKQAVGARVREMGDRGLVSVETDRSDRRATVVRRTPAGDDLRERIGAMIADLDDEFAAIVGADRYRTFREVLDELAAGSGRQGVGEATDS